MKNRVGKYILIISAYLLMAVVQTYPTVSHLSDHMPGWGNATAALAYFPEQSLLIKEYPLQPWKWYDPGIMGKFRYPYLLLPSSIIGTFVYAPLYWATGNILLSINLWMFFWMVFSGLGGFWLTRYWLGSERAAFLGGAIYAFTGPFITQVVAYEGFMNPFFPLILLTFDRFAVTGRGRDLLYFSLLMAIQFYANMYLTIILFYLLPFFALYRRGTFFRGSNIKPLIYYSLLSLVLTAPLAFGMLYFKYIYNVVGEMAGTAVNIVIPSDINRICTCVAASEWLRVAENHPLYSKLFSYPIVGVTDAVNNYYLFPGFMLLVLLFSGLIHREKTRISKWFLAGILFIIWLNVQAFYPPVFFKDQYLMPAVNMLLSSRLPMFEFIRCLYKLLPIMGLFAGIIAGLGYMGLEGLFASYFGAGRAKWLFVPVMVIIQIEQFYPKPLYDYKYVIGPGKSDYFLMEGNIPFDPDDLIFHIPDYHYTNQPDQNPWRTYEETYTSAIRHQYFRQPVLNAYMSFTPRGWEPWNMLLMPEVSAQKYMEAVGVKVVVVHDPLIYGPNKIKFSHENMIKLGMKHVKTFDDGDRIYLLDQKIRRVGGLYLLPEINGDNLKIGAVTGEYYLKVINGGGELTPDAATDFWVNPKLCRLQKMRVTIRDGSGRPHTRRFKYYLPLVEGGLEIHPVEWDLSKENFKGPFSLESLGIEEPYLLQPPDAIRKWKLEPE